MEITDQDYAAIKLVRLDWSKVRAAFQKMVALSLR